MAINASTIYRVRAGGNNVNGGGFDSSIALVLSTTLTGNIGTGTTSIPVASRSGFPASGSFYMRIGVVGPEPAGATPASEVVLVTGGQGSGAGSFTVTRAQLGTVAVAFNSGTVCDNNLSQCDTAAFSGSLGTSTAGTTFTDAAGAFNETVVGNTLWLASGAGTTVSAYCVTAYVSATQITLDRASGTYTVGVWKIGGAWADYRTNVSATYMVAGYKQYLRAVGVNTPAPGSPTFGALATASMAGGSAAAGASLIAGEFGWPTLKGSTNTICTAGSVQEFTNVWLAGAATGSTAMVVGASSVIFKDCGFDQNGFDQTCVSGGGRFVNVEMYNSGAAPAAANAAITLPSGGGTLHLKACNLHDLTAGAIVSIASAGAEVVILLQNIFAANGADHVTLRGGAAATTIVDGNTYDGNFLSVNGLVFTTDGIALVAAIVTNNLFTNFNQASKFAITNTGVTTTVADKLKLIIDYNTFWNNTANYNAITAGANDTQLTANPYVSQSTEDFRLATGALSGVGYPTAAYPQSAAGKSTAMKSYVTPGAIQPQLFAAVVNMETSIVLPGAGSLSY